MSLFEVTQLLCTFWTEKNKLIWRLHRVNNFSTSPRWVAFCSLKKTTEIWRLLDAWMPFTKKKYKKTLPKLKNGDESWISLGINVQKVKKLRTHKKNTNKLRLWSEDLRSKTEATTTLSLFFRACLDAFFIHVDTSVTKLRRPRHCIEDLQVPKGHQSEIFSQQKHPEPRKNPPKIWWFLW